MQPDDFVVHPDLKPDEIDPRKKEFEDRGLRLITTKELTSLLRSTDLDVGNYAGSVGDSDFLDDHGDFWYVKKDENGSLDICEVSPIPNTKDLSDAKDYPDQKNEGDMPMWYKDIKKLPSLKIILVKKDK